MLDHLMLYAKLLIPLLFILPVLYAFWQFYTPEVIIKRYANFKELQGFGHIPTLEEAKQRLTVMRWIVSLFALFILLAFYGSAFGGR